MTTVHRIGAAVVIIVSSHGYGKAELIRMAMRDAHTVVTIPSRQERSIEDILRREQYVMPLLPVVVHRREWLNALLARDTRQYLESRRERSIQRLGIPPSPSWTAAMRARRHQSNNLVTKPAW